MFLEPTHLGFPSLLEERFIEIRDEFQRLSGRHLMPWPEKRLYNQGWDVFGLWALGRRLDGNCHLCPITAATVAAIPGMTTAGFSVMGPGTRIRPHVGYSDRVLRCHLGLIVPANCGLQVGEETRQWDEGKCLVFDDTVTHSAWNNSDQVRVVLLVDFLRTGCLAMPNTTNSAARACRSKES